MLSNNSRTLKFDDEIFPDQYFDYQQSIKGNTNSISVQTKALEYKDIEISTKKIVLDKETEINISDIGVNSNEETDFNQKDLINFLIKTVPLILETIEENNSLKSLSNYEVKWNERILENRCLYTLHNKSNYLYEKDNNLQFTDISWNSTGMIVGISLGKFEHEGFCQDKSYIYIWNIAKRDLKSDTPSLCIETSSCIMSLIFHPTKPNLLYCGTFNGQLLLYDISKQDENLIASSTIDEYFHRESITQLLWLEQNNNPQVLASISTDSKLLIWQIDQNNINFPAKGHSLVRKKDGFVSNVGPLCLSQSLEDKNTIVIGTEAGSVLRAFVPTLNLEKKQRVLFEQKLEGAKSIRWKEETYPFMFNLNSKLIPEIKLNVEEYCKKKTINEVQIKDIFQSRPEIRKIYPNPISSAFEPHMGPVFSINFSPFHRNLFLTGSLDGAVKLYDLLQIKPIMVWDHGNNYIFKIGWSYTKPTVFAAISSNGDLYFYDLSSSNPQEPSQIFKSDPGEYGLNFSLNKKQYDLLAVGYSTNKLKIVQLCENLTVNRKEDANLLSSLIE